MNFYDVLAAEKWDGGIPTMNFFDLLFAQSISGKQWQVYEGTLPATLYANGSDLRQYQVWGNTGGVGDKTENLCKINGFSSSTTEQKLLQAIILNAGTYTFSCVQKDALTSNTRNCLMIRIGQAAYIYESTQKNYHLSAGKHTMTFTVSNDNVSVELRYWINEFSNICAFDNFMLTEGTTAPASFVPFGYEVDMAVGSNILQSSEIEWGGWQAAAKTIPSKIVNHARCRSKNMYPISGEKIFYDVKSLNVNIVFIDSGGLSLGGSGFKSGAGSVDVPTNAVKCLFIIANTDLSTNILPAQVIAAKIWASVDATTTPIYIGNEPLWAVNNYADYTDYQKQKIVRAIKKYVLTGEENWEEITGAFASRTYFRYVFETLNYCVRHVCISSHFTQANITTATTTVGFDVFDSSAAGGEVLAIRPSGVQSTTLEDFKAWLAEQYAAGTPVTVWCALTTAEEIDPPVTLPALPTVEGTTIVDYAGQSVAPEKVYFEYQGGKQP